MSLMSELSKPEYELLSNQERLLLVKSKTERVVGKIQNGATLHLVSMLARGLREKINNCQISALRNAWQEALQPAYLASSSYSINVALPEIRGMLDAGLVAGVCNQTEYDFIVNLASYDRPLFPDAKYSDVVNYFNPELIGGNWNELSATDSQVFVIKINAKAPEQTHIVIQWQDGVGDWYHATALHGIQAVKSYTAQLPYDGEPRALRWRCEYALDCVVSL